MVTNFFTYNGSTLSSAGGINYLVNASVMNRLSFNSFYRNEAQDGTGQAIECSGQFVADDNIMYYNGTLTYVNQTGGTCAHKYSIASPGTLPTGTGNSASNPMFVNTTTGDLHIMAGSPARHAADPAADLSGVAAKDLDGDSRVAPADIGADEVP